MTALRSRAIRIRFASGEDGWTSRLRAVKGMESGRYKYVDEGTVRANEEHPGHKACLASMAATAAPVRMPMAPATHSVNLPAARLLLPTAGCELRTFARYPIDWGN